MGPPCDAEIAIHSDQDVPIANLGFRYGIPRPFHLSPSAKQVADAYEGGAVGPVEQFGVEGEAIDEIGEVSQTLHRPVCRDVTQPIDARGLARGVRPEAPRSLLPERVGRLSHRLRFPSKPESPAATARRRAKPA